MPIYLYSNNGLSLAVYVTALQCYAWIVFLAGKPNQIVEWGETVGQHGLDEAIREGRDELTYQVAPSQ